MAGPIDDVAQLNSEDIRQVSVSQLHLDPENPRFGAKAGKLSSEQKTLDFIVANFGIKDVLSSIAVNGYFPSEPIVAIKRKDGDFKVVEGNRRLAACLILSDDDRASNQTKRIERYRGEKYHHPTEVPVIVFSVDDYESLLLPYLGVRHITGSQPWDSYAKAEWVARVVGGGIYEANKIAEMIGEQQNTVSRILLGYYFVKQAEREGHFHPQHSYRSGRGSNPDYPFSWVYTALGYLSIKKWLDLDAGDPYPKPDPVPKDQLKEAGWLLRFMFGDSCRDFSPTLRESRDISDLADVVSENRILAEMKDGCGISQAIEETKPNKERLSNALRSAEKSMEKAVSLAARKSLAAQEIPSFLEMAESLSNMAKSLGKLLSENLTENFSEEVTEE